MKNSIIKFMFTLCVLTLGSIGAPAQGESAATVNPDTGAAKGLDLYAVAELFKDSENLEKFEQALNNPTNGINNLDLNNNGEIDFIRVTEQSKDNNRLIILQSVLGENEFQDVGTIAVERESGGKYNLQIQGDQTIYGANYYVVPANNNFSAWNVVRWIFSPGYRVYVSPYSYRVLPRWWSTRRPVEISIYRSRAGAFVGRRNFITARTVKPINRINYRPRTSTIVTRRTVVTRTTAVPSNPRPAVQTRTVTNRRTTVQTTTVRTNSRPRRGKN